MNIIKYYIWEAINSEPALKTIYETNPVIKDIVDQICSEEDDVEAAKKILNGIISEISVAQTVICDMHPEHIDAFYEVAINNFVQNKILNTQSTNSQVVALIMQKVFEEHHNKDNKGES